MKIKSLKQSDLIESFSGIRGIFGKSINEDLAYKYGWSYCKLFKPKSLVVSGDSRESTPVLKKAIVKAFSDYGVEKIIDFGIVPVQTCEYGILEFKADGGVYISASHNEPEYNGFKFLKEDGALLYKRQADRLIGEAHKIQNCKSVKSRTKIINKRNKIIDKYIDFILKRIGKKSIDKIKKAKIRILVDPNGGSGIEVFKKLFKELNVEAQIINDKTGQFVRLIEPNSKSLSYLSKKVDNNFEFASGFDCDSDRVEIVIPSGSDFEAEMGQTISGQYVLALACDAFLEGTKNQIVVTNDCTSYLVRDIIKKYGAKVKETEVGEMIVVEEMEKQKSIIGGEGSCGGIIIPPIKCRDGIMTICLILKMIADRNKSLVDILKVYPRYYSERVSIDCPREKAVEVKDKLENYFKDKKYNIMKTGGSTGGLKALIDKSSYIWFRQSKTEPGAFRIISDGDNHKKVKELLKQGIELFNRFK
ncbi:hypothetical protein AMJ47_00985 [Parcubacteria bacterium DG_72]|nr:MAG: hypothetical protein AMJ47_00985 [Parcubacteria bacterium DG_72]